MFRSRDNVVTNKKIKLDPQSTAEVAISKIVEKLALDTRLGQFDLCNI